MQAARGASLSSSDTTSTPTGPSGRQGARRGALVVFASIAVAGYVTDLVSKVLAVQHLTGRGPVSVVGDVLTLYLARNPGAAFSTGTSYTVVLTFVAIAAGLAVLWTVRRVRSTGWAIGLGFLMAGVLGNLTDRIFRSPGVLRGHVVDFLQLPNWPIFNVADVCINIAAGVVILQAVRGISVNGTRPRDAGGTTEATPDESTAAS
ncbi:MAG: signal peptidase II [Nocardioidaceae bacterium]